MSSICIHIAHDAPQHLRLRSALHVHTAVQDPKKRYCLNPDYSSTLFLARCELLENNVGACLEWVDDN